VFWVGDQKLALARRDDQDRRIKRKGLFVRELSGDTPYFIFEITKGSISRRRALVE